MSEKRKSGPINGWIDDDPSQRRRGTAILWLLDGGGGHEDGMDGFRALRLTGEGLLDFLEAYQEYLEENILHKPSAVLHGLREIVKRAQEKPPNRVNYEWLLTELEGLL